MHKSTKLVCDSSVMKIVKNFFFNIAHSTLCSNHVILIREKLRRNSDFVFSYI